MRKQEIIERAKEIIKEEVYTNFEIKFTGENEKYLKFEVVLNEFCITKQVRILKEDFNIIEYNLHLNIWRPIEKIK